MADAQQPKPNPPPPYKCTVVCTETVCPCDPPIEPIPTLSLYALVLLILVVMVVAVWVEHDKVKPDA